MTEGKSIALVNAAFFDPYLRDGASITIFELLRFLKEQGHQVSIYNFMPEDSAGFMPGFLSESERVETLCWLDKSSYQCNLSGVRLYQETVHPTTQEYFASPKHAIHRIYRKLRGEKIDYVLTLDSDAGALLGAFILGLPGAHYFHSVANIKAFNGFEPSLTDILRTRRVFAASRFLQGNAERQLGIKVSVWRPFVDFSRYLCATREGIERDVGYVSSNAYKGDSIVREIIERMPECRFFIAGWSDAFPPPTLPSNVTHMGGLHDMREFYGRIGILLVPSLVEEGCPRVILEAAGNGIPAIANRIGGIPEALGEGGILIEVGSPETADPAVIAKKYVHEIARLLNDDSRFTRLRDKARQRAGDYDREQRVVSLRHCGLEAESVRNHSPRG